MVVSGNGILPAIGRAKTALEKTQTDVSRKYWAPIPCDPQPESPMGMRSWSTVA